MRTSSLNSVVIYTRQGAKKRLGHRRLLLPEWHPPKRHRPRHPARQHQASHPPTWSSAPRAHPLSRLLSTRCRNRPKRTTRPWVYGLHLLEVSRSPGPDEEKRGSPPECSGFKTPLTDAWLSVLFSVSTQGNLSSYEDALEVLVEGEDPDGFLWQTCLAVGIELASSLCFSEVGPVGSVIASAAESW